VIAMFYFATPSTPQVRAVMREGVIGAIETPYGTHNLDGIPVCAADNGCFGANYVGDEKFLAWLESMRSLETKWWFAVAPDVVGNAEATLKRSAPFLPAIRELGYPVALAAQNGLEDLTPPWDDFDVLFLGGDTTWKLSPAARALTAESRKRGKDVHMGRVNSQKRLEYAAHIGCTSADGTYLAFGPDVNLRRLRAWLRKVNDQGVLFEEAS
jgi:hypothetical protein